MNAHVHDLSYKFEQFRYISKLLWYEYFCKELVGAVDPFIQFFKSYKYVVQLAI